LSTFDGLFYRRPTVAVCFSLALVSLIGLPPLAGFMGKFAIFGGLANAYLETGNSILFAVLIAGSLNTAISLFYYLGVVRRMISQDGQVVDDSNTSVKSIGPARMTFLVILTFGVCLLLIGWGVLGHWVQAAGTSMFSDAPTR